MDLGFDHQKWLQSPPTSPSRTPEMAPDRTVPALDWIGLKARFIAAHALRREMLVAAQATPPGGDFVTAGEQVLDWQRKSSPDVNPTGLGNVKGLTGITTPVAGNPLVGNRGLL
ncbi:MAG: hypothetical protein ABIQ66_10045 [Novosphingobium sp.]